MKKTLPLLLSVLMVVMGLNAQTPKATLEKWDFLNAFRTSTGRQYGVATEGEFIYTCAHSESSTVTETFYKYDKEGALMESFSIPGCPYLRDMTYDGQYFYAASSDSPSKLYCFDLVNKTLIGSFNTPCTDIRHTSYDPVNDGFWIGTSQSLMLVNRNGALVTTASVSFANDMFIHGTGYFADEDGSHLFMLIDEGIHPSIFDYNITTDVFNNEAVLNFENTPGYVPYGGAGGAFVGVLNGRACFLGDEQCSPNMIAIYDLDEGDGPTPPDPPTPVGDYYYDFENGSMQWTLIDADGDGYNWEMRVYGVPGSSCCVTSSSNYGGNVLEPDNYMVSPVKDYYDKIQFKTCPQNSDYSAEHIGVAVSTDSNTNPEDFVTVWEKTLTGYALEWEEVEVDLSQFGGREIWVAIRHFDCKDQFWVNADDIALFVDPTALEESATAQFQVYPNPANDKLVVNSAALTTRCDIFTVTGALVSSHEVGAKSFEVDVEPLPAGVYFIRLTSEGTVQTRKFLKN